MARVKKRILKLRCDEVVCEDITVEKIFMVMRHMHGYVNFFSEIEIEPGRIIFGESSGSLQGADDDGKSLTFSRKLGCVVNGDWYVWEANFVYSGTIDYFDDEDPRFSNAEIFECGTPIKAVMRLIDLQYMEVSSLQGRGSFFRDISGLITQYQKLKNKIDDYRIWGKAGLVPAAQCFECGHYAKINLSVLAKHTENRKIFTMKYKLRCQSCGRKGSSEVLPIFKENNRFSISRWKSYIYGIKPEEVSAFDCSTENDLYDVLGGDGTQSVYLTDGTSLTAGGRWEE